jgi:hypothetical protein
MKDALHKATDTDVCTVGWSMAAGRVVGWSRARSQWVELTVNKEEGSSSSRSQCVGSADGSAPDTSGVRHISLRVPLPRPPHPCYCLLLPLYKGLWVRGGGGDFVYTHRAVCAICDCRLVVVVISCNAKD